MYHRIYASKYRQEVITLVWDFLEHLPPGDSISTIYEVNVLVSSGVDPNPLEMLKGAATFSGTVVQQHVRRGIPGTIYTITISVQTVGGDILESVCYLAILPTLGDLVVTIWETTQLYPLDISESLQGFTLPGASRLTGYGVEEPIQGFTIPYHGLLQKQVILYQIPPENIQGFTIPYSGHLQSVLSTVTYHVPHEDIQGFTEPVSGMLIRQGIFYNIPHEDIQGFTIPMSGHLA